LLEDDLTIGASLRRLIARSAPVVWVTTISACRLAVASQRFSGLVLDVSLPDGSGVDLLHDLREGGLSAPALVMTGSGDHRVANRCYALSAACVYKPGITDHVAAFVRRTLVSSGSVHERRLRTVELYSEEHELTKREREVLVLATLGIPRERLAAELGITENTVKTLIRRLLGRCDAANLDDVVRAVLARMAETAPELTES